jgi:hypothetical protein
LIASMGISGGTSAASAARTGHASAVNARIIITNVIFFCVFFTSLHCSGLGPGCWLGRKEKGEVFRLPGLLLEHFIPVS